MPRIRANVEYACGDMTKQTTAERKINERWVTSIVTSKSRFLSIAPHVTQIGYPRTSMDRRGFIHFGCLRSGSHARRCKPDKVRFISKT